MLPKKLILIAAAVFAVAVPATASAKKPEGAGNGKSKGKNHLLKGTVSAVDVAGGVVTVTVNSGNKAAQALQGRSLQFNVSGAKLQILDANSDGVGDLNDVAVGDDVQVQAKFASGAVQPYAAKRFKDEDVGGTDTDTDTETAPTS
jgi:hypothetical protein